MFDPDTYYRHLNTQWLGHDLIYREQLESTNTFAKELPSEELSHGTVCLTDNQTRGRGQYERSWESEPGKNLTFTLCLKPTVTHRFHVLTLSCALTVINYLNDEYGLNTGIKWPNDVMAGNYKVGGLLTETTFNGSKLDRVLIGIGLNINQVDFDEQKAPEASSLTLLTGSKVDREKFLTEYLSRLEFEYRRWLKNEKDLLKDINKRMNGYGRWIQLRINGEKLPGSFKLIGVNEEGELTVLDDEGSLKKFSYEQVRLITD